MRRPLIFGLVFGLAAFGSLSPSAHGQTVDMRFEVLAATEKTLIDRLAADFYEEQLRQSQASAIETHTSELYVRATPAERARFREERRAAFEDMPEAERKVLRDVKRPTYRNLTESQKAPFRSIALDNLDAAGVLDREALADALKNDI
ncbi:MAG: hypothetical protein WD076_09125 [Parvularculaceae bacterium]